MSMASRVAAELKSADLSSITALDMCARFGMAHSTFSRHLRNEGTSFTAMLDAERARRVSEVMHRNPKACAQRLMLTAGYSHPNSAARSFKRWFGTRLSDAHRSWGASIS